jgi:hypothetical protein
MNSWSAGMGSISIADGASRVVIVGFPAQKNHRFAATVRFDSDARNLTIPSPRLQIEHDSFVTEDFFVVGAILDSVASGLSFLGVVILSVPFLRTKLNRSETPPERV